LPQFWPLHDAYRTERNLLGDRKVRLITDYLAKRDTMNEDDARRLTREFFSNEKDRVAVKEKYIAKMSKVLSARTVARFLIESIQ
jgi:polyhydroxyalkanoate synthesis regulator phasin